MFKETKQKKEETLKVSVAQAYKTYNNSIGLQKLVGNQTMLKKGPWEGDGIIQRLPVDELEIGRKYYYFGEDGCIHYAVLAEKEETDSGFYFRFDDRGEIHNPDYITDDPMGIKALSEAYVTMTYERPQIPHSVNQEFGKFDMRYNPRFKSPFISTSPQDFEGSHVGHKYTDIIAALRSENSFSNPRDPVNDSRIARDLIFQSNEFIIRPIQRNAACMFCGIIGVAERERKEGAQLEALHQLREVAEGKATLDDFIVGFQFAQRGGAKKGREQIREMVWGGEGPEEALERFGLDLSDLSEIDSDDEMEEAKRAGRAQPRYERYKQEERFKRIRRYLKDNIGYKFQDGELDALYSACDCHSPEELVGNLIQSLFSDSPLLYFMQNDRDWTDYF